MAPSPVLKCCKRALNWVPVLFINLVVGWSYYAYVVELCVYTIPNNAERISYLVIFHIFLIMFIWSYWKTIWSRPASPSKAFVLPRIEKEMFEREERAEIQQEILKKVARNLPVYTRTAGGAIRYCDPCQIIKPDRCHHCSTCETCVLKMDHHCPWVNNCVGFSNYKYFVLFLAYAALYCAVICATVTQYFIKFWTKQLPDTHAKFHILFLFFVAALFFISVLSLLSYHLWLVGKNRTTIEAFRAPVISTMSCFGMWIPKAVMFTDMTSNCYFAVVVYKVLVLMIEEFGGSKDFLKRFSGETFRINTGPCCCCCPCLPRVPMSRRMFFLLKLGALQYAILKTALSVLAIILWTNGNFDLSDLEITGTAIWINPFIGILTIISLWPLAIIFMNTKGFLRSLNIIPKYAMYQLVLVLSQLQTSIINILALDGTIACAPPFSSQARGSMLSQQMMIMEMFIITLVTRYLYRRTYDTLPTEVQDKSSDREEEREEERVELRVFDGSPWLRIADESCLAPRLLWQPGRAARQK
ncbi:hypothetical protein Q8A73_023405 [Channa argus]|nr:hypothetical protein Q8A73_023405 [Channa argus]